MPLSSKSALQIDQKSSRARILPILTNLSTRPFLSMLVPLYYYHMQIRHLRMVAIHFWQANPRLMHNCHKVGNENCHFEVSSEDLASAISYVNRNISLGRYRDFFYHGRLGFFGLNYESSAPHTRYHPVFVWFTMMLQFSLVIRLSGSKVFE